MNKCEVLSLNGFDWAQKFHKVSNSLSELSEDLEKWWTHEIQN